MNAGTIFRENVCGVVSYLSGIGNSKIIHLIDKQRPILFAKNI